MISNRIRRGAGFTIIELVVALAIGSVLMAVLLWSIQRLVEGGAKGVSDAGLESDALRLLDRIETDVRSLLMPSGNKLVCGVRIGEEGWTPSYWALEGGGMLKPDERTIALDPEWGSAFADERWGRVGAVWMGMAQGPPGNPEFGSAGPGVVAFSWYLGRMVLGSGADARPVYCLMRGSATAGETFRAAYDLEDSGLAAAISPQTPNIEHVMGLNVIDFGVRFWVREAGDGSMKLIFPSEATRSGSGWQIGWRGPPSPESGPMIVEVFVRVLSEEGARLIHQLESGNVVGDWWDVAERYSKVFSIRVVVESGA